MKLANFIFFSPDLLIFLNNYKKTNKMPNTKHEIRSDLQELYDLEWLCAHFFSTSSQAILENTPLGTSLRRFFVIVSRKIVSTTQKIESFQMQFDNEQDADKRDQIAKKRKKNIDEVKLKLDQDLIVPTYRLVQAGIENHRELRLGAFAYQLWRINKGMVKPVDVYPNENENNR